MESMNFAVRSLFTVDNLTCSRFDPVPALFIRIRLCGHPVNAFIDTGGPTVS